MDESKPLVAGEIATRHPKLPVKLVTSRPALGRAVQLTPSNQL